jgi:hypothetical protein
MPSRVITLRWDGGCRRCEAALPKGTRASWDSEERRVTCLSCVSAVDSTAQALPPAPETDAPAPAPPAASLPDQEPAPPQPLPELDRGRPGASAAREHQRRKANREARTRRRHPWIGGLLLSFSGPPQHERAWDVGGRGEEVVGRSLERRTAKGPTVVLHDRRMPRGRGNIDHLAVAPNGVFVIDAKALSGKVRIAKPLFGEARLMIAGRNRTKLSDGLTRQVDAVRAELAKRGDGEVPVLGVLCFTKADLPWFGRKFAGHHLQHCRGAARKLNRSGPYDKAAIDRLAARLCDAFPQA